MEPEELDNDPNTESDVNNHRHDSEGNEEAFVAEDD